jgi:uncharacterized repeat protein (TIGR01451 family)
MNKRMTGAAHAALPARAIFAAATMAAAAISATPADAAGTVAGTKIDNVATATYELPNGGEESVDSNTVSLTVDELLDVTVASADSGDVSTTPGAIGQLLRFTLTNAGNGDEAFTLTTEAAAGGDDFDPSVISIVLDTNGNGGYDAGVDTVYVAGSNDPQLAPDESLSVFVISSIPAGAADGNRGRLDLAAVAKTGSGTPGTSFAGAGQGGGNAIVGATGADAEDDGWFAVAKASVSFAKSAAVSDVYGGASQIPGSTITYTLTASVGGSGSLANIRVADAVPAGTTYKAGSLTLEGSALTDAADADAGRFTGTGIAVSLGTLAAGASRSITFQVKID